MAIIKKINKHLIAALCALLAWCLPFSAQPRATTHALFRDVTARKGDLAVIFRMKLDKQAYTFNQSYLAWGVSDKNEIDPVNYRCAGLTIKIGTHDEEVNEDVYSGFSNLDTVSISRSPKGHQFAVHLSGGDAAGGYWATISFKFIKFTHQFEPVSRVVRNGEFPNRYYEKCIYHLW